MIFHGIMKIFIFFKFMLFEVISNRVLFQKIIFFSTLLRNEKDFYMFSMSLVHLFLISLLNSFTLSRSTSRIIRKEDQDEDPALENSKLANSPCGILYTTIFPSLGGLFHFQEDHYKYLRYFYFPEFV